jgi:CRP-like cAMP-binding protein
MSLLRSPFSQDNRGYITKNSLKKLTGAIGDSMRDDDDDESQLSLSGFSELLADNMKNRYFPAGHVIYHEGDKGDKMYFINSGRVEVSTMDGFKTVTNQGDFFGEGALLNSDGRRSATIRTITPVHALEISREYFEKYLKEGNAIQLSLREKDKLRKRDRAKTILKAQRNMEEKAANKGEHIYHQGVIGDEVFILESGEIDVLVNGYTVFKVKPGEMCGEQSIIYSKPRNTSAVCASNECKYHSMEAVDFVRLMNGHQALKESFRDMCLRREFQKAIVFETKKSFPERERDLREAFDAVDFNKSGFIDLSDIAKMLKQMDSTFTDEEIQEILESLDLDRSGNVSFEEFVKMFCTSKKEQKQQ